MFINTDMCIECGGTCCKTIPGACFPSDFDLPGNYTKLDAALQSGKFCIDWWEGDPRPDLDEHVYGYFVRPATKGMEGKRHDASWGGVCTFLSDTGCVLAENDRPLNCQYLEPNIGGDCICHDNKNKQNAAIAWLPYCDVLTMG